MEGFLEFMREIFAMREMQFFLKVYVPLSICVCLIVVVTEVLSFRKKLRDGCIDLTPDCQNCPYFKAAEEKELECSYCENTAKRWTKFSRG